MSLEVDVRVSRRPLLTGQLHYLLLRKKAGLWKDLTCWWSRGVVVWIHIKFLRALSSV